MAQSVEHVLGKDEVTGSIPVNSSSMNENKIKIVCEFYAITHKLKNILRTGWKIWEINAERIESVAEHIYGTQMLALAINSEFELGLDMPKVALMLAIHELGETVVGDIPMYGSKISKQEKQKKELEAVQKILGNLNQGKLINDLFIEFEKRETKEARFVYLCDKLEVNFQCKYYEENGNTRFKKEWDNGLQHLWDKGIEKGCKTFAEVWIDRNKTHLLDDPLFASIAEYVAESDIYGTKSKTGKIKAV